VPPTYFGARRLLPVPRLFIKEVPWFLTEVGYLHGRRINDIILLPNVKKRFAKNFAKGHVSKCLAMKLIRNPSNYPAIPGSRPDAY
jgi:hypothetical protein